MHILTQHYIPEATGMATPHNSTSYRQKNSFITPQQFSKSLGFCMKTTYGILKKHPEIKRAICGRRIRILGKSADAFILRCVNGKINMMDAPPSAPVPEE
jgi:hypothetical protein